MKKLTLLAAALFLCCAEIPEELRAEANSSYPGDNQGYCYAGNAYYGSPDCPGYYDCPNGWGCVPSSSSSRPSSSSSDPCSGNAYYSSPNCGGYYTCPSGWGCYHYSYCVYHSWQQCDQGSYNSSNCGGEPMDYCPYSRPSVSYGTVHDSRDSQIYNTVEIGRQNWMAENLNYDASGSVCYDYKSSNCGQYGRLYSWEAAKNACPTGFRLPSKEDWDALAAFVESDKGCSSCDARHLKAKDGWNSGGNGLDSYGFAALPGGYGSPDGGFYYAGYHGRWWSASENDSDYAYYRYMYYSNEYAGWYDDGKTYLYSVRCLQD